jgi:hypothetical protein
MQAELQRIVETENLNLGELFSYIHLLSKPGGIVRVPAEKRRVLSKSVIR